MKKISIFLICSLLMIFGLSFSACADAVTTGGVTAVVTPRPVDSLGNEKQVEFATSAKAETTTTTETTTTKPAYNQEEMKKDLELVNYKGVIKILVGLLLAKLWVDLSTDICIALIDTCTDIASSVFTSADEMIVFPSFDTLKSTDTGLWIIGELLNQLLDIVLLAPIIIVALAILIICGLIMIKLMLRTFELALYCSVSPAFFACLLGDATKGYFKRFIDGLLSSALSLVYMGLIYLAGSYWCKVLTMNNVGVDSPMDVLVWLSSAGPKVLVVLAMGFLILKPPLALRQLTGGS